jgi:hypothetical protein
VAINTGYIEATCDDGDIVVRIYYDATAPHATVAEMEAQPLINGPRGFCLDLTNLSGKKTTLTLTLSGGGVQVIDVQQGNPVTTGPVAGRSKTAAQLASAGYTTRGSVGNFQLDC